MIDAAIQSAGVREIREKLLVVLARVQGGQPLLVMQHGESAAVIITHEEAERWVHVDMMLAAFHGMEIYPDAARDTTEIAAIVRQEKFPSYEARRRVVTHRPEVGGFKTVGIADLREHIAEHLDQVSREGRAMTVLDKGRLVVTFISVREFERLRRLRRVVSWFRAAGLDLVTASESEAVDFVKAFRQRPAGSGEAGTMAG